MKTSAKTAILVLLSTAVAFAESPKQLGAWSIYPGKDNHVGLLQSTSNVQGQPAQAKLDVICRNGKLSAIALEPSAVIQKAGCRLLARFPLPASLSALKGRRINPNNGPSWTMGTRFLLILKSLKARSHGVGRSASPVQRRWVSNWIARPVKLPISPPLKPENWPRLCRL